VDEDEETLALANSAGLRCFTTIEGFKNYVRQEVVGASPNGGGVVAMATANA